VESIRKLFPRGWFGREKDCGAKDSLERFRNTVKKNSFLKKDNLRLREMKLVVLDTETTGLNPGAGDEIISIGACLIRGDKILPELFHRFTNPYRPIPPRITELTGINDEMVAGADDFYTVMADFLEFLKDRVIVGHAVDFDINFLNYKLKPYNMRINNYCIDTGTLSKALYPHWKEHTLDNILANMDITPHGRHTAQGDALLTAEVFLKFAKRFEDLNIKTFRDLRYYLNGSLLFTGI
jgi:DNA polymerase-3 subunit epsilon